jgi:hypothetical protein
MLTFSQNEIQSLKKIFKEELSLYKVYIGKFNHVPIIKDSKKIDEIINKYTIDQMLEMLKLYETKYYYKLPSKNGDKYDLANMLFYLYIDPFFYNTPFEILPKYTLFDLSGFSFRQIIYVCKQYNIDLHSFITIKPGKSIDFSKDITPDQRRNFIEICKSMNIVIL